MKKHMCDHCKLRAKHDNAPKSFIGRFWRRHISFCLGWKSYMKSLDETQKNSIKQKYQLKKAD